MSDTPRTDKAYEGWMLGEQNSSWMEFARQLERESSERWLRIKELEKELGIRSSLDGLTATSS
jgi:hypothetical protein